MSDRACWMILAGAMAAGAALILFLNRGGTYYVDELNFLYRAPALEGLGNVLEPQNGHLVATTRVTFKLVLEAFGAGYVAFRLLAVAMLLACVALFYALIKPRIGAFPALAPAVVLLLFGSDSQHVAIPVGFTILTSVATGLGALLAAERRGRGWDLAACALLALSVVTFGAGLAFVVAVAISVLLRDDRWWRVWIFLVPVALYGAWWVWALGMPSSGDEQMQLSNAALIPVYAFESLAAALAAITGLNYHFHEFNPRVLDMTAGAPLALAVIAALTIRLKRGSVPALLWAALGIVLTYWALGALVVSDLRPPGLIRYLFVGALGVMLAGAAAAAGVRWSRFGLGVLFGIAAIALATNLALLRDGAAAYREHSANQRAEFTAFELARGEIDAIYAPGVLRPELTLDEIRAGSYFEVVDRYGSPAFSLAEVDAQPNHARQELDRRLAQFLGIDLEVRDRLPRTNCQEDRADAPGAPVTFELPEGGAVLRAASSASAPVTMARFGEAPTAEVGSLEPGAPTALEVPADASDRPWRVTVDAAGAVVSCSIR